MPYFLTSTIFFLLGLGVIVWVHSQYHIDLVVTPAAAPASAPLISICVPARDEEKNIRRCVEALLAQTYPNFEIIVLDDRSTDSTPQILEELTHRDSRLHVIHGSDLPDGWAGKPYALTQASAAVRGDWLCFVDADTFAAPEAIESCYVKALETQADMFTIMTFQELGSFWEKVLMPIVMTALSVGFSPRKVNDPKERVAVANGQFILIKRAIYDAVGGHERIKDQIVEDKALAEQVKWNGHRLVIADGHQMARTRMYTSLPQMWEGWTKNITSACAIHHPCSCWARSARRCL
jgi:chlorobactene glucosyltransferase